MSCLVASKGTRPQTEYCYEQLVCHCSRSWPNVISEAIWLVRSDKRSSV
jgi:hypothetical protein